MSAAAWAFFAIAIAVALIVGPLTTLRLISNRRNNAAPMPENDLREALLKLIPVLQHLPDALRQRHAQRTALFLKHKRFVGCDGLEVSDEMRLAVAGFACLLVLQPDAIRDGLFPAVKKILLYPDVFLVPVSEPDEFGLVDDEPQERIGESWQGDRVVLSWRDVQAALQGDEVNVVVHEFAHQLDDESLTAEGAPNLPDYQRWSAVMQQEFERLRRHRRPKVLDPYGAESPAEFFGVVTEAFIQRGAELAQHHAALYELLRDTFGYDTRDWLWPDAPEEEDA
ncbi:zinc-dependent peptidase [Hydrocarboniphaga sp.]|uniref:M90 family metallopeptidase n=1 Tax=Hydrocarboniphaga sp. TaxID=2033016 RepID=UPI003D0B1EA6